MRRSQTIAIVPERLAPMDERNKLLGVSSALESSNFAGIAYRPDTAAFMAVQEHVPRNASRWGGAWPLLSSRSASRRVHPLAPHMT